MCRRRDKITLEVLQPVGRMLAYFCYPDSFDLPGYLHMAIDPQLEADLLPVIGFAGLYNYSGSHDVTAASYQFQTYGFGSLAEADVVFSEFTRIEQEEFGDRVMFTLPEADHPVLLRPAHRGGRNGLSALSHPGEGAFSG